MSADGTEWYKRFPRRWLASTRGLSAKEHAVFAVVIELIYDMGGSILNDPKFIAGHFSDIGPAAVRNSIATLIEQGFLFIDDDGQISNRRAAEMVMRKDEITEKRVENGKKGGRASGKARRQKKALEAAQVDETRYERVASGEVIPFNAPALPRPSDDGLTLRECLLVAMRQPKEGMTATGKILLPRADMAYVAAWQNQLKLSDEEIIGVVADVSSELEEPVTSIRYFERPMRRYHSTKTRQIPPLEGNQQHQPRQMMHRRSRGGSAMSDAFRDIGGFNDPDDV